MFPWHSDRVRDEPLAAASLPARLRSRSPQPATGDPRAHPALPLPPGLRNRRPFPLGHSRAALRSSQPAQKGTATQRERPVRGQAAAPRAARAAKRSPAPPTLGFAGPLGTSPGLALTPAPPASPAAERAPPCGHCGSGPGRPLGAVVPCPSPDAVGRRSRDYSPRQAARPQRGWCNHTLARPGAGASAGCHKDGFARDSSTALARALLSGPEGCSAIRMRCWDLLLPWWHRNAARSVVSIAIKFAGSGHERIERVRVTVPALRRLS